MMRMSGWVAAAVLAAGLTAHGEDAPQSDEAARKALEERLKAAAEEPAKPTGKVKKVQKGTEGEMREKMMERFDEDKNGVLDPGERAKAEEFGAKIKADGAEHQKRMLERFDANKDGKLDEAEQAKAHEMMEKRMGLEKGEIRKRMLEKFDANKDGKLDEKEQALAREEFIKNQVGRRMDADGKAERKNAEGEKNAEGVTKMSDEERTKAQAEFDKIFGGN